MPHRVSLNNLTISGSQVNSLLDCHSVQHRERSLLPQALPWQTSHLRDSVPWFVLVKASIYQAESVSKVKQKNIGGE